MGEGGESGEKEKEGKEMAEKGHSGGFLRLKLKWVVESARG